MSAPRRAAPWTDAEVANLNYWQTCGYVHPFTCPNNHPGDRDLVAHRDGWHCPNCVYTQSWAHEMMLEGPPPNPLQGMMK
jgi:hypothetical protein